MCLRPPGPRARRGAGARLQLAGGRRQALRFTQRAHDGLGSRPRVQAGGGVLAEPVDIARSLAPYVIVFDGGGRVVASSVMLKGQQPNFPVSVFDSVRRLRQDRITWQPAPGVRSAAVVVPYRAGFVLAGRSLRLAEEQVDSVGLLIFLGWLVTLVATAAAALVGAQLTIGSGRL